jgi:nicotinamide-nucleotide amidase
MQAEIIAIGDELTSGQRLDTNSQWLSQQLADLGIKVVRHTTVGDQLEVNVAALRSAAKDCQLVLMSGGLGPTLDDLTREALSCAFSRPLQLDPTSLQHIEQLFSRRGRVMPERNRVQAMFPEGAIPIPNPHGSAPGIDLTVEQAGNNCRFMALPGVPAEMKQMWDQTVKVRLQELLGSDHEKLYYHSIKLFGLGESEVEARVPTLIARGRFPTVGITVSQATITLRIAAAAKSIAEFERLIAPTVAEIESQLGELIFGAGDDELQDALLRELSRAGQSLACVEIGAGAWVNQAMLSAAHSDNRRLNQHAFRGGLVFVDQAAAHQWLLGLGLIAEPVEPADPRWWTLLAKEVTRQFAATIGMAIGPYPAESTIAMAPPGAIFPFHFNFSMPTSLNAAGLHVQRDLGGHPEVLNCRAAKSAMELLRKSLRA